MNELVLDYNLFDLPTAQHKAGLAGLLIMIESMKRRGLKPLPKVLKLTANQAAISFTKESLQAVFDDFFRADEVNGKVVPKAQFLDTIGMPQLWLTLWRDVITRVLRAGAPTQLEPFRDRTGKYPKLSDNCPNCKSGVLKKKKGNLRKCICQKCGKEMRHQPNPWDWEKLWEDLKSDRRLELSGTDIVGIESVNAERIPYSSMVKEALLLQFWPIVTLPYISQQIKRSKNEQTKDYFFSYYAFVLAIPEVSELAGFAEDIFDLYPQSLFDDTIGKSNRPKQSLITIEKEAALAFASRKHAGDLEIFSIPDLVSAITVIHLKYGKGSPEIIEETVVVPKNNLLKRYENISSTSRNQFFKQMLIENLFLGNSWYHGVDYFFSKYPREFFIYDKDNTPQFYFFGSDAKRKFSDIKKELEQMDGGEKMTDEGRDHLLARRIYALVRHYTRIKAENKSGKRFENFKKDENGKIIYPKEYREAVEKICMDAFLAMRGRREQDFVEYFTGTICSIPQFLPPEDYLLVSQALLDDWERVKSLAMLAMSANSYISQPQKAKGEQP
jgi:CRISPR-associated protein Cmx8